VAKEILCSRGSYYESNYSPLLKGGMFQLFPLLISPVTPIIITSATVTESDIVSPNAYLDNDKLLHSYGQAWGQVNIEGEILLGSVEFAENGLGASLLNSAFNGLRAIEFYFALNRASISSRPIILSALRYAKPVNFYLTNYKRGRMNVEFNIIGFSLQGWAIGKKSDSLLGTAVNQFI